MEVMRDNIFKTHKHTAGFWMYFKLRLNDYIEPLTGFDIIKFDDDIKTPDGKSTHDWIVEHYGKEANALVEKLLGIKRNKDGTRKE